MPLTNLIRVPLFIKSLTWPAVLTNNRGTFLESLACRKWETTLVKVAKDK